MVLPAELIDHIFSFLQTDFPSLKACSKAHPLLSRLAERHLYAHVVIDQRAPEVCNDILQNPRFLDYPRALEMRPHLYTKKQLAIPFLLVIPRMANVVSLKICHPCPSYKKFDFFSTLGICLQQSSIQELHFFNIYDIPFSFLDDARNIKQLTLSDCTALDDPISGSPSSQLCLETLVLSGRFNPRLHRWATRWVTRLTTLELQDMLNRDWSAFPELLVACSNSLTRLCLDISNPRM